MCPEPSTPADDYVIPTSRKLLYVGILCALVLVAAEGALRVRAWMRYGSAASGLRDPMISYDAQAQLYVPTPGYEIAGERIHIKINSLGFRGDEFSRAKPAGVIRVVCLGASTTFSSEVSSNDATWPHRLQERLAQAYPGQRFEVINAALGGYVADDNLKNLRHRVLPLDPDIVIYYEANNEIVKDTRDLAIKQGLTDGASRSPIVLGLSRASLLFDLAYKNLAILSRSRDTNAARITAVPRDLPAHFLGVLDEMRGDLAARQIPFVLSTFIVKYRPDQDRKTQIANADVAFYYMPWMSIEGLLDAMATYNAAILQYGREHGLPVVDDRDSIPADAEHFSDCMHLLDKGADAMAARFERFFRSSGMIERAMAAKSGPGA